MEGKMEGEMEGERERFCSIFLQRHSFFSDISESKTGKTTFMSSGAHSHITRPARQRPAHYRLAAEWPLCIHDSHVICILWKIPPSAN
ncbi:TPA: hypothetical protein DEG75_03815 [Candidatus Dependentiae bacterium]|nr:hypothetical protein [Candidatus Dependentiae bacterium]